MLKTLQKIQGQSMEGLRFRIIKATVTQIEPLEISIEQRMKIPEEGLVIPESLQRKVLQTKDWYTKGCSGGDYAVGSSPEEKVREYVLQEGLKVGDIVLVINLGTEYLIFDKEGKVGETIIVTQ